MTARKRRVLMMRLRDRRYREFVGREKSIDERGDTGVTTLCAGVMR
jgi:hypothetical protein